MVNTLTATKKGDNVSDVCYIFCYPVQENHASEAHAVSSYLCSNWLTRLGVVKVCGDVELEQLAEFTDDVLRSPILILPPELVICLDDFCQLVGQIILRPVASSNSLAITLLAQAHFQASSNSKRWTVESCLVPESEHMIM